MASGSNQDLAQSQLSATDKNVSIESQVKNLVTGLQSQDMFSNSTPVRSKLKDNRRLKQTNKTKRQTHVFAAELEADNSINPAPVQVIEHDEDLPQSGQQLLEPVQKTTQTTMMMQLLTSCNSLSITQEIRRMEKQKEPK